MLTTRLLAKRQVCFLGIAVTTLFGCGTPTGPSLSLPLSEGAYVLRIFGGDFMADFTPVCDNVGVPKAGKFVTVRVDLRHEGSWWVGRSSNHAENLTVRIQGDHIELRGIAASGTLSGTAADVAYSTQQANDVRFSAEATPASLDLILTTAGHHLGSITGAFSFSDSLNKTAHCTYAEMTLDPW